MEPKETAPARERPRRELELQALNALRRIIRALRLSAQRAQSAGMSAAQLYVLRELRSSPAPSINDLGVRTLTDRSSVGAVVERLVRRGFVERSRSSEDRRRAEIRITAAGRKALQTAPAPPTSLLLTGLARLQAAELEALSSSLQRLVEEMGLGEVPAGMLFDDAADSPSPATGRRRRAASPPAPRDDRA